MAPRSKFFKKKSHKKRRSQFNSSSVAASTTEESFVNSLEMACTSSPDRSGILMIRTLTDTKTILAKCKQELEKQRDKMICNHQRRVKSIINKIDMFKVCITPEVGNSLVGECTYWQMNMSHDSTKEESGLISIQKLRQARARQQVVDVKQRLKERTPSKSKSQNRNPLPSQFKTPNEPIILPLSVTKTITPKVDLSKPTMCVRRPKQGEMAVSVTGSPLLVSSVMHDEFASVNVPLPDGKIMAILPRTMGYEPDNIPNLDSETIRQLETLKGHLQLFCDHANQ